MTFVPLVTNYLWRLIENSIFPLYAKSYFFYGCFHIRSYFITLFTKPTSGQWYVQHLLVIEKIVIRISNSHWDWRLKEKRCRKSFLVAYTRHYKPLCRSVGPPVRRSAGPSVRRWLLGARDLRQSALLTIFAGTKKKRVTHGPTDRGTEV